MAKRPQRTTKTGVPTATPDVVAAPLDTSVIIGNEGMPAAPGGLARPAMGPDQAARMNDQAARDAAATARAFQGLSANLRGAAFSREEYLDMLEDEGAQLAAYIDFANDEKLVFTKALSDGQIQAMDHPRFQAALAEGAARNRARLIKDSYNEAAAQIRVGDNARNIDAYDSALNGIYESEVAKYRGPRDDVYRAELQASYLSQRDSLLSKERREISDFAVKDAGYDLVSSTTEILEKMESLDRNTIIEQQSLNPNSAMGQFLGEKFKKTVNVYGESDKDFYNRQVQTAADEITAMLDGRRGDLLSSENMNLIVGRHLIELAKSNAKMSRFAEDVLKRTVTGPAESRAKLLSGRIKDEYLKSEGSITSTQGKFNKAQANKIFRSNVDAFEQNFVQNSVAQLTDKDYVSADYFTTNVINELFPDGRNETILEDGTTLQLRNDEIIFKPSAESGADTTATISLKRFREQIEQTLVKNQQQIELDSRPGIRPNEALAFASATTQVPHKTLQEQLERGRGLSNRFEELTRIPQEGEESFERWDGYVESMRENLSVYKILRESNGLDLNGIAQDTREFYEGLEILTSDSASRIMGGEDFPTALLSMSNMNEADADRAALVWESGEGSDILNETFANEDNKEGMLYVDKTAKFILKLSPDVSAEQAIGMAMDSYSRRYKELQPGVRYDSNEWSPDFDTGIREWQEGDWDTAASVLSTIFGGSKREIQLSIENAQQTGMMAPEMLNAIWDAWWEGSDHRGSVSEKINQSVWEIAQHANYRAMLNIQSGKKKPVTWTEVLDRASSNLVEMAPDDFTVRFQNFGGYRFTEFKFIPVKGTKGNFYYIKGITEDGLPRLIRNPSEDKFGNARPFNRNDIIELFELTPYREPKDPEYMTEEELVEKSRDDAERTGDVTGGPTYD